MLCYSVSREKEQVKTIQAEMETMKEKITQLAFEKIQLKSGQHEQQEQQADLQKQLQGEYDIFWW